MGNIQKVIWDAKEKRWPVGLYGLGQLGQDMGIQFLDWIGLGLDFVCDKNEHAIETYLEKHPEMIEVSYGSLLSLRDDVLIFVCVGVAYIEEVCGSLRENPFLHVITIDDITSQDSVLEKFYDIQNIRDYGLASPSNLFESQPMDVPVRNERVAVYTCVTGGYDYIKEPLVTEENCDYYLLSDRKYSDLSVYRQLDIEDFIPAGITGNAEKNRWCKMHGHRIFSQYRYSIYLDGTIQLVRPVSHYVKKIGRSGIALHKHPLRNCIYEEGLRLIANKRENVSYQRLREQMLRYMEEGMPREYGLFECGMLVQDHFNTVANQMMEQWFEEYRKGEKRDQLSLTYIMWKNGIPSEAAGILNEGQNIRKNPDFMIKGVHGTKK